MKCHLIIALMLIFLVVADAWAISLNQAARQVADRYQGRVISAHTADRGGRRVHVIRVVTKDGKVKTVRIPADS